MKVSNGAVIYRGPSMLDGKPIVVVINGLKRKSKNSKTGDMLQTYIIADGINPLQAAASGADVSVCGDCKHRKANLGTCYVTLVHGPNTIHKGLQRSLYPSAALAELPALAAGRIVRLGTYGDPMAVPVAVWQALLSQSIGHTGYTHQWHNAALPASQRDALLQLVMASVDSETEALAARTAGYRYFRVRTADQPLMTREIVCPASAEAGYKRSCETCKACSGGAATRASVAINVHGNGSKRFALQVIA
jgi:hypothetical protein